MKSDIWKKTLKKHFCSPDKDSRLSTFSQNLHACNLMTRLATLHQLIPARLSPIYSRDTSKFCFSTCPPFHLPINITDLIRTVRVSLFWNRGKKIRLPVLQIYTMYVEIHLWLASEIEMNSWFHSYVSYIYLRFVYSINSNIRLSWEVTYTDPVLSQWFISTNCFVMAYPRIWYGGSLKGYPGYK